MMKKNMKNIFKNIFLGGALAAMLMSCDMNLTPSTSIVFDEDEPILLSQSDIISFYNGVLSSYRAVQYGSFTQSTEVMCDGFNATIGFGNNNGSIHRTDASFTTSDSYAETMWASHYAAIKNYNVAIEQADLVTDEELVPYAELLKGVALFCRASSYLTLARHFGPAYDDMTASEDLCVPLVLKFDIYEKPARASVQEVYDRILWDLDDAEDLLTDKVYQGQIRSMEPTLDAISALKARYFLDVKEYSNAAKAAESVINSEAGYALAASGNEMVAEYINDSGSEPIIQLYASMSEGAVGNTIFTQVSKDREGKYFQPYYIPSQKLIDAYDTGDLRLTNWFSASKYPIFTNGSRYEGIYTFIKYYDNPSLRTGSVETGAHCAKPLMISEMYLIAAEAYAMDGVLSKAKAHLNTIQTARKAKLTSGDLENVKKEWFRETVGEGLRLSCLKRWGDGFEGRPAQAAASAIVMTGEYYTERTMEAGAYVMNWPVPSYELKLNDNLVQNAGYEAN